MGLFGMDLAWLSAVLVGAGCIALGYLIGSRFPRRVLIRARLAKESSVLNEKKGGKTKEPLEIEKLADILEDFKMVIFFFFLVFSKTHIVKVITLVGSFENRIFVDFIVPLLLVFAGIGG